MLECLVCLPCVCVYVVSLAGRWVDWLLCALGSACYVCKFKEGVIVANLLLIDQYFLLVICLYVQCLPTIHA
jgi:hypothetical protein